MKNMSNNIKKIWKSTENISWDWIWKTARHPLFVSVTGSMVGTYYVTRKTIGDEVDELKDLVKELKAKNSKLTIRCTKEGLEVNKLKIESTIYLNKLKECEVKRSKIECGFFGKKIEPIYIDYELSESKLMDKKLYQHS